jgi:alpha-D-xyloside xylohydrolase
VEDRWKNSVKTLREQGYPLDAIIFDNLWRVGGGSMFNSSFEWDLKQVPDPAEFGEWLKKEGLLVSLDLNRQNNRLCKGWNPEFNLPIKIPEKKKGKQGEGEDSHMTCPDSCPDYTSPAVCEWSWNLVKTEGFGPQAKYPFDALWLDGTDHIQAEPNAILKNGWRWDEAKGYYTFLIAKTFVTDGWEKTVGEQKRPYCWVRSASPGVQRSMIHWSGDTNPNLKGLEQQVINLQSSGICGFAYFNHDAGGFRMKGPTEEVYRQWACAFSSFTPIWRPHGMGEKNSRRPDAWSEATQKDFMEYATVRYEMIPYIYTYAHESSAKGTPMARAMFLAYADDKAWDFPHQYMWGNEMLVAPNVTKQTTKNVWLPAGDWYDFWTKAKISGDQILKVDVPLGRIPVYVKAGAIIPKAPYCLSTQFIPRDEMIIDLYLGAEGEFTLVEDDNVTEKFRQGQMQKTRMELLDGKKQFTVYPAEGSYDGAVQQKSYTLNVYGFDAAPALKINGQKIASQWNPVNKQLSIRFPKQNLSSSMTLSW